MEKLDVLIPLFLFLQQPVPVMSGNVPDENQNVNFLNRKKTPGRTILWMHVDNKSHDGRGEATFQLLDQQS